MSDILFISGSPIKNRNNYKVTERMVEIAKQEGFKFIEHLSVSDLKTYLCVDCNHCKDNRKCINEDANAINSKLVSARAIVVCSPVYFGSVSAQIKAIFDTSRPIRRHGMQLKTKIGAAVAIGGSRNGGQETTIQTIHNWMHIHGMVVVGDGQHYGGTLKVPAMEDDVGLITAELTIKNVCNVLKKMKE